MTNKSSANLNLSSSSHSINKPIRVLIACGPLFFIQFLLSYSCDLIGKEDLRATLNISLMAYIIVLLIDGILLWYFSLCISAHAYHVMTFRTDRKVFFANGRRIIGESIVLGLVYLLLLLVAAAIYNFVVRILLEATGICNLSTLPNYSVISATIIGLMATSSAMFMMPMILVRKFHKFRDLNFSSPWPIEGLKFFFQNYNLSIHIIILMIIGSSIHFLFFTKYYGDYSPGAMVIKGVVALISFFLFSYAGVCALYVLINNTDKLPKMYELIRTSDYDEANAAVIILSRANIVYATDLGIEDGINVLREGKSNSVGFYVYDSKTYDEARKLLKDLLSDCSQT